MSKGTLSKMSTEWGQPIKYSLQLNEKIDVNALIGKEITLHFNGDIFCRNCSKKTKKSFGEGFCYNCFISAPENSECIIRPELCRAHLGEGRDPEWEERNHNQPHVVYLAASDCVKVGVTRATQIPTRWIDQGAASAIKIAETPNRYEAGVIEVALKDFLADKTNWQRMLKNEIDESIDLVEEKWELHDQLPSDIQQYFTEDDEILTNDYPVKLFPTKVKSLSFDKTPMISGKLTGIKGQYLIFEDGSVLNIRKHTSYFIELSY